jgi:hypothetical protein
LALRTGAAIVPVYLIRQPDDGLKLIVEPELELDRSAKGNTEVQENTARMTRWLERTVRENPTSGIDEHPPLGGESQLLAGEKKQLRQGISG